MKPTYLTYLNALDVEALALTDDEIIEAVESGLAAQGRGETVIEPALPPVTYVATARGDIRQPGGFACVSVLTSCCSSSA